MAFEILGMSIYLWIALISLVFLVVLVGMGGFGFDFGGDADVDLDYGEFTGPGISPLSPPLLATFGTSFGSIGALLELSGTGAIGTAVGAALGAVLISAGMFVLVQKFLVRSQTTSEVKPEDLVGRAAQVMIPMQGGRQGQILVITEERGRTLLPAVAAEDLPRNETVEILGFSGGVANVRKKIG